MGFLCAVLLQVIMHSTLVIEYYSRCPLPALNGFLHAVPNIFECWMSLCLKQKYYSLIDCLERVVEASRLARFGSKISAHSRDTLQS